ncbi:MAG TPA: DoxX family protein [Burkholderiales bacterium]|nr:DoxX family protein [Burkholderiales bacterium]
MKFLEEAGQWLILAFFLVTGLSNLTKARIADHIGRMRAFGTPFPAAAFWLGIALQFTGCALVAAGWHAGIGVACLIVFLVVATAIFHRFWQKSDPVQRNLSRLSLLANVAILGALLLLLADVL